MSESKSVNEMSDAVTTHMKEVHGHEYQVVQYMMKKYPGKL